MHDTLFNVRFYLPDFPDFFIYHFTSFVQAVPGYGISCTVSGVEDLLQQSRETAKNGKGQDNDVTDEGGYQRRTSDSSDYGSGNSNSDTERQVASPPIG